jgi:hypothetical protein
MSDPTIFVMIGNSDNKLPQAQWATFCEEVVTLIDFHVVEHYGQIHGVWFSLPNSPWQNMCISFELSDWGDDPACTPVAVVIERMKQQLGQCAYRYRQDSIAWAMVSATEFLSGDSAGDEEE